MKINETPSPRSKLYTNFQMYPMIINGLLSESITKKNKLTEFGDILENFLNIDSKSVIPCSMARVGIYMVIKHFITVERKDVILSPYTIADVINMVICAGGVPVFCDIEGETCNIDVSEIEGLISPSTACVMVTHFYGLACNIKEAKNICDRHNIPIIEDAAQALGVKVDNQHLGTFGTAGIFSFGLYKNVTSFIGGAIITTNSDLSRSIHRDSDENPPNGLVEILPVIVKGAITDLLTSPAFFKLISYKFFRWATLNKINFINNKFMIDIKPEIIHKIPENYMRQMRPIQGEIIENQLANVDSNQQIRIQHASQYYEGLKSLSDNLLLPPLIEDGSHGYPYFILQVSDRERLETYMLSEGCDVMISSHRNCADLECFQDFYRNCPNARETSASVIYLPTYPDYMEKDIDRNINIIKKFYTL